MKIVDVKCNTCEATFETIESYPKELIACISCGGKDLQFTVTEKEFEGCGGGCDNCSSCE